MSAYLLLKYVHVTAAVVTTVLFITRLGLDMTSRPGWRKTSLRFVPHINDTILLVAAIGLCVVTGWYPFINGWNWLTTKVLLLCVYIVCGKLALDQQRAAGTRVASGVAALVVLGTIFGQAFYKAW